MPTQRQQDRAADRATRYFHNRWGEDDNTLDLLGKWLPILGALGLGGFAAAPFLTGAAGTAAAGGGLGGAAAAPAAGVSWAPWLAGGTGGLSGATGFTGMAGGAALPAATHALAPTVAAAGGGGFGAAQWANLLRGGGQLASGFQGEEQPPMQMQVPQVGPYQAGGYDRTRALIAALFGEGGGY